MSEDKGWGKTVLGWFVVTDDDKPNAGRAKPAPVDDADRLLAKYGDGPETPAARAPAAAPASPSKPAPAMAAPSGPIEAVPVDFPEVFVAAGVDASEQDRVQKALDLLNALPSDTPTTVKKQIVEASLRAFGFPIESIIEAGVAEIEALDAFIGIGQDTTQKLLADSNARIEQLQAEIIDLRTMMENRLKNQAGQQQTCNGKKLEIQKVLEFFGQEAVAKVVRESPRLHEPTDAATKSAPQS